MRIVIRGTNWIGDSIMAIPAMRRLRGSFPEAHIALHTRRWAEGIFRDADFIDAIIAYEPTGSRLKDVVTQSRSLKYHAFDVAVLFPNSFESALAVRLAGIRHRFGFATDRRGLLLTDAVPVPAWKDKRHESNYYLELVGKVEESLLGKILDSYPAPATHLDISDARRREALEFLTANGVSTEKPLIGLGPGSTNSSAKRWPTERFAQIAERFVNELDASVILLGSNAEKDVADAILRFTSNRIFDLTGKTDLAQATAILSLLGVFISNDMGLAHTSAAVDTPTLSIFGPTNEITTRPLGKNAEIVRETVECSPCMLRECPIDHRCMTRVEPGTVFETARRILQNRTDEKNG